MDRDASGTGDFFQAGNDRVTEVRVADATGRRGGAVSDAVGLELSSISWSPWADF